MFENIRKKKQQPTDLSGAQPGQPKQRINIDVNEQVVPMQQPMPQQTRGNSSVEQVYTMPQKFLPQQSTDGRSSGSGGSSGPKKPRKKIWIILIIVIAVVLLSLVGVIAYVFTQSNTPQEVTTVTESGTTTAEDAAAAANTANENAEETNTNTNTVTLNSTIEDVDEELNEEVNSNLFGNENTNTSTNTNSASTPQDFSDVGNTTDTDKDGLTDEEEINVYGTREKGPDTDGDGYIDGTEVASLFSPIKADQTLLKSGLVIEEKNKEFGWSIYYPAQWLVEPIDDDGREVLFTPDKVDTEFVEVIVQNNVDKQTAEEWYTEQYEDLDPDTIENVKVGGLNGIVTQDGFTYYLADNKYIIGIIYNVGNSENVHFRTTFEMMVDSFLYTGNKKKEEDNNANQE